MSFLDALVSAAAAVAKAQHPAAARRPAGGGQTSCTPCAARAWTQGVKQQMGLDQKKKRRK